MNMIAPGYYRNTDTPTANLKHEIRKTGARAMNAEIKLHPGLEKRQFNLGMVKAKSITSGDG